MSPGIGEETAAFARIGVGFVVVVYLRPSAFTGRSA
jgi:hypothetical protein